MITSQEWAWLAQSVVIIMLSLMSLRDRIFDILTQYSYDDNEMGKDIVLRRARRSVLRVVFGLLAFTLIAVLIYAQLSRNIELLNTWRRILPWMLNGMLLSIIIDEGWDHIAQVRMLRASYRVERLNDEENEVSA